MNETKHMDHLLKTVIEGFNPYWVQNAGITHDMEALRKICMYHAEWWNETAWPAIVAAAGSDEAAEAIFLQHRPHKS